MPGGDHESPARGTVSARRAMLETRTGIDLDGDGYIGARPAGALPVKKSGNGVANVASRTPSASTPPTVTVGVPVRARVSELSSRFGGVAGGSEEAGVTVRARLNELKERWGVGLAADDGVLLPAPCGLIVCTLVICATALLMNVAAMGTFSEELASFEAFTKVVTEETLNMSTSGLVGVVTNSSRTTAVLAAVRVGYGVAFNAVFGVCACVSALMTAQALALRVALKHCPALIDDLFALRGVSSPLLREALRDLYLSWPHLLCIGGLILSGLLLVATAAYAGLASRLSAPAYLLCLGSSTVLVAASLGVRSCVTNDLVIVYTRLLCKGPAFEDALLRNTPAGASRCLLLFGVAMLLLDAPLFIAPGAYAAGLGLPPALGAPLTAALDACVSPEPRTRGASPRAFRVLRVHH